MVVEGGGMPSEEIRAWWVQLGARLERMTGVVSGIFAVHDDVGGREEAGVGHWMGW